MGPNLKYKTYYETALRWRHNERDSVSNHQPHDCLLNRLFRRRSKKTSKLRVTGLCVGNSAGTGEFPAQMAIHAENVSIWWRHHGNVLHYIRRSQNEFLWYLIFAGGSIIPHPVTPCVSELRQRLCIGDIKPSSKFQHTILCNLVSVDTDRTRF